MSFIKLIENANLDNLYSKPGCHVVSKAFSIPNNPSQEYKSNINTWGQALSMGDNRKKNNKNYDKPYPELPLI
jgi:hypothetical protein